MAQKQINAEKNILNSNTHNIYSATSTASLVNL